MSTSENTTVSLFQNSQYLQFIKTTWKCPLPQLRGTVCLWEVKCFTDLPSIICAESLHLRVNYQRSREIVVTQYWLSKRLFSGNWILKHCITVIINCIWQHSDASGDHMCWEEFRRKESWIDGVFCLAERQACAIKLFESLLWFPWWWLRAPDYSGDGQIFGGSACWLWTVILCVGYSSKDLTNSL